MQYLPSKSTLPALRHKTKLAYWLRLRVLQEVEATNAAVGGGLGSNALVLGLTTFHLLLGE